MAYQEFYIQTTGSNLNSGTTSSNTATVTSTGGTVSGTLPYTFTAASGTPFSGVSVGDWCSLYPNAATSPVFFAKIASIGGGGASITTDSTNIKGSAPAGTANATTCKIGGAWADTTAIGSLSSYTATGAQRVNIKAGTYSFSASQNWQWSGTAVFPVWFRGYRSSPGDLDSDTVSNLVPGTDTPYITSASAVSITAAPYQTMSFVAINTASASAAFIANTAGYGRYYRCRFSNTNNTSGASAATLGAGNSFVRCYFSGAATQAGVVRFVNPSVGNLLDCVVTGGSIGILQPSTSFCGIIGCHISGFSATGISQSTASSLATYLRNTINGGPSTNGYLFTTITTAPAPILNNIIANVTNITNATNGNDFIRLHLTSVYNYTNLTNNQNADVAKFNNVAEPASPFLSSSNLTPNASACNGINMTLYPLINNLTSERMGAIERDPMVGFRR